MGKKRRREVKFMKTLSLPLDVLNRLEEDAVEKGCYESVVATKALKLMWAAEDKVADKKKNIEVEIAEAVAIEVREATV